MTKKMAWGLSLLFHPLLLPSIFFLITSFFAPGAFGYVRSGAFGGLLVLVFLLSFGAPSLSLAVFYLTGTISSLAMKKRSDRHLPYWTVAIFYWAATYFLYDKFRVFPWLPASFAAMSLCLSALAIINLYWKISAHSIGTGGFLGCLFALIYLSGDAGLLWPLAGSLGTGGALLSARLFLKAHNPAQIGVGLVLGLLIGFVVPFNWPGIF